MENKQDKPQKQGAVSQAVKELSKYVRMKKGAVIQSVEKNRIEEFKRKGFTAI
jgi:hypothetical protein